MKDFIYSFVDSISDSKAARHFALVKFASSASVESSLDAASGAMDAVVNLRYTSGWTATSDAIAKCREELKDSTAEKIIVLITDGSPTRPLDPDGPTNKYKYAREQALEQATSAKETEDTSIVGVFVNTTSGTSAFLEELTTPGLFVEVTDFDELDESLESLVDIVQCPPPPPDPTPPHKCEEKDVDICIAMDRSGSVCAPPGGPYLHCNGDPDCGQNCTEWTSSVDFAKRFLARTDQFPGKQRYALVGFASKVVQESTFVSADETTDNLDSLVYTGGYTHTGGAIDACRELLAERSGGKTILLLTDGIPTRPDPEKAGSPYDYAKEYALERAIDAKEEDGITIVGVFINTGTKTSSYLKELVTPGFFLKADFNELDDDLLESVVSGIECTQTAPASMPSSELSSAPNAVLSSSPTSSPTCDPKDVDVCFAIDRSGSICKSECEKSQPCPTCTNWEASIDFTDAFITSTLTWDGQQRFALATFGNYGKVQSTLTNAEDALAVLRSIPYKREWTNTMDGLQFCRDLLGNSTTDESAIILITDGSPTRPTIEGMDGYDYAKEKATETATMVKEVDGSTLMTVAVGTSKYASRYLQELATSEDHFLKVDNFDELEAFSGRIAALVSCA